MTTHPSDARSGTRSDRRLTITYYVEPQAMRRLTIPVTSANAIVGVVAASVLWTVGTVIYFAVVGFGGSIPTRQAARTAIPKTGHAPAVKDVAPVESLHTPLVAEPAKKNVATMASASGPEAGAYPGQAASAAQPLRETLPEPKTSVPTVVAVAPPAGVVKAPEPAVDAAARSIELVRARAVSLPTGVKASVEIVNKASSYASGAIWGVARFVAKDGTTTDVADSAGAARTRYKAQRMSKKELTFEAPEGSEGKFSDVTFHVSDARGGEPQTVTQTVAAP